MSSDTHIKFEGVDGEATHKDHKGEIEVLSWNWNVTNSNVGGTSGGGSGKGKATPGDFSFTHVFDKASPILAKQAAAGKHFATVVLTARKAGEGQKDFLKVTMKEAFITAVSPSGGHGGEIIENVAMSYKDIEFEYKPQDDKGGLGGAVKFGWNIADTSTR
ncbi:Hcp family type VI secretion system effector [Aquabacterium sp.]|uniref:Hcp family type VI secretion system effector n=1 Tax=Aquabacterium sp. TaxID=1872578 RepID=UPI002C3B9512|nr:type VI secretion system tube protein Hcp [Aquabacterium sp.]HSW08713.1 type VI secretion system tube protein Hcp [Aquabacterium sp.]